MNKQLILIISMLFNASVMMAGSGIFQTFVFYTVNGGGLITDHGGIDNASGTNAWSGNNLGTNLATLILDGGEVQTFKNGGSDVTGATLFYRVYKQGTTAPAYGSINLPFLENFGNPGDQKWNTGVASIDLLSGVSENGTYNIDLYWEAYSTDGTHSDGSAAAPLTATFSMTTLPIELIYFKGIIQKSNHLLSWQTATETNNSHFNIERSTDAKAWSTIGQVQGTGTTSEVQSYAFEDKKPFSGQNYYRLKQLDYDGAYSYSPVVSLIHKNYEVTIYPNPVNSYVEVKFDDFERKDSYSLLLTNSLGQLIKEILIESLSTQVDMDSLSAGIYNLRVVNKRGKILFVQQLNKL